MNGLYILPIALIVISVGLWIFTGFLSYGLRIRKGYEGGLVFALFFGIVALIYNAGLPDKKLREKVDNILKMLPASQGGASTVTGTKKWKCQSCGNMISTQVCPYCDNITVD